MTTVIDFAAIAGNLNSKRESKLNPVVAEIVLALMRCGGEAHRSVVADAVSSARACKPRRATEQERAEIFEAFDRHLRTPAPKRHDPIVRLPFGPDSHRWGLTPSARSALGELASLSHL